MNFVAMMELTFTQRTPIWSYTCFSIKVMGTKYPDFIPACTKEQTGGNRIQSVTVEEIFSPV